MHQAEQDELDHVTRGQRERINNGTDMYRSTMMGCETTYSEKESSYLDVADNPNTL